MHFLILVAFFAPTYADSLASVESLRLVFLAVNFWLFFFFDSHSCSCLLLAFGSLPHLLHHLFDMFLNLQLSCLFIILADRMLRLIFFERPLADDRLDLESNGLVEHTGMQHFLPEVIIVLDLVAAVAVARPILLGFQILRVQQQLMHAYLRQMDELYLVFAVLLLLLLRVA